MRSVLALILLPGAAAAQGDAEAGRALAEEVCAACHPVEPGAGGLTGLRLPFEPGVPMAFEDVANTAGVTATVLEVWLASNHPTMPDLVLTAEETADVIAYILGLRDGGT